MMMLCNCNNPNEESNVGGVHADGPGEGEAFVPFSPNARRDVIV